MAVESEHSALSTCIGAEAAGARAVTATSSAGLAFMWELLHVAASSRLPITLACVCRALTGPININNDHSDAMNARDAGWIQIYAENNQEAYDNYLQAMPIGGDIRTCACRSWSARTVSSPPTPWKISTCWKTTRVKSFVGEYQPENYLLKHDNPLAVGPYGVSAYYMEAQNGRRPRPW